MKDALIAANERELEAFLHHVKAGAAYHRSVVQLDEQKEWMLKDHVLSHKSGGFFHVVGAKSNIHAGDEYLMLYQPQGAVTGLILCKAFDTPMLLLQARVEPGNSYIVQYGPTIQSTAANYLRIHGGKATHFAEYFLTYHPKAQLVTHSMQQDLGKRYFQKSKTHHYVEVKELLPTPETMIWVPVSVLRSCIHSSNFLNADLRSLLAVFDWDAWLEHATNATGISTIVDIPVHVHGTSNVSQYHMCGLHELSGWSICNKGILPKEPGYAGVQMFSFASTTREVSQWVQPLLTVQGVGLVQQLIRQTKDGVEWLLRLEKEVGTSTAFVYGASYSRYPDELPNPAEEYNIGDVKYCMRQCDEGGRFMENDTHYEIREVDGVWQSGDASHCWVSTKMFKGLLATSNLCSFQLRNVASLMLEALCPNTFGPQ